VNRVIKPLSIALTVAFASGGALASPLPSIATQKGNHALMVDGKPYLLLGAQVNNSSAWPAMLGEVWPAIEQVHANTVLVPMAWEQVEPREGSFDFSFMDTLVNQARQHHVHLVLLWFATWKNNSPNYAPSWVKLDNNRFPRVVTAQGKLLNSLSPHATATREADTRAFVAMMTHLKKIDGDQHTVIMVQVENESGTYGTDRDHSPAADKLFAGSVPAALLQKTGKPAGSWRKVFGGEADEMFHAWSVASFIGEVARAGKTVYALPMYANVALRDPFKPGPAGSYASGGPTDNVLDVWKAAAPALDILAPDIYMPESAKVNAVLDRYRRDDNPLYVAEIGNATLYARYAFATFGRGGIGFAPFGMDFTGYSNYPLGARKVDDETLGAFGAVNALLGSFGEQLAGLALQGKTWGAAEPDDSHESELDLGAWRVHVGYGQAQFGVKPPEGNPTPSGGVVIAQLAKDEYLVTGFRARVNFYPGKDDPHRRFLLDRVEEGHYENGQWVFRRLWNGDQTDYGLTFTSAPQLLRIKLATY
jgi:beta-galactosidase GanA